MGKRTGEGKAPKRLRDWACFEERLNEFSAQELVDLDCLSPAEVADLNVRPPEEALGILRTRAFIRDAQEHRAEVRKWITGERETPPDGRCSIIEDVFLHEANTEEEHRELLSRMAAERDTDDSVRSRFPGTQEDLFKIDQLLLLLLCAKVHGEYEDNDPWPLVRKMHAVLVGTNKTPQRVNAMHWAIIALRGGPGIRLERISLEERVKFGGSALSMITDPDPVPTRTVEYLRKALDPAATHRPGAALIAASIEHPNLSYADLEIEAKAYHQAWKRYRDRFPRWMRQLDAAP